MCANSQNKNHSPQTFRPQGLVAQAKTVMFGSDLFAYNYQKPYKLNKIPNSWMIMHTFG